MKHLFKSQPENFKSYLSQVSYTVHTPQCNLMLTDNYHIWY